MAPIRPGTRIIASECNKLLLKEAPFTFFEKLEESLRAHCAMNGWKAIATHPELELHIPFEKVDEFEQTKDPVGNFLRYLIFERPHGDELTVERMEVIAMKIRNQQIVKEFTALKKEMQESKGIHVVSYGVGTRVGTGRALASFPGFRLSHYPYWN